MAKKSTRKSAADDPNKPEYRREQERLAELAVKVGWKWEPGTAQRESRREQRLEEIEDEHERIMGQCIAGQVVQLGAFANLLEREDFRLTASERRRLRPVMADLAGAAAWYREWSQYVPGGANFVSLAKRKKDIRTAADRLEAVLSNLDMIGLVDRIAIENSGLDVSARDVVGKSGMDVPKSDTKLHLKDLATRIDLDDLAVRIQMARLGLLSRLKLIRDATRGRKRGSQSQRLIAKVRRILEGAGFVCELKQDALFPTVLVCVFDAAGTEPPDRVDRLRRN